MSVAEAVGSSAWFNGVYDAARRGVGYLRTPDPKPSTLAADTRKSRQRAVVELRLPYWCVRPGVNIVVCAGVCMVPCLLL